MKYWVVYCATIDDDKHRGYIKIGDTDILPQKALSNYAPNDPELQKAAIKRIKNWSGTAAAGAKLDYCDISIYYNPIVDNTDFFRDHEVHKLLKSIGVEIKYFDGETDNGKEWYKTNLETVIAAINALKDGRDYLDTSELPEQEIYPLREEQQNAVDKTHTRFKNAGDMLWHAKMRFGKTISALNLVKKEGFKHTIIITHRPVVEDSWGTDFYHVFSKQDKYAFLTKVFDDSQSFDEDATDEAIDKANEEHLKRLLNQNLGIVYFASIQDLRGSKIVGGKYEKNNLVFETEWDCVIIDEAHEGTKTERGQAVIEKLVKTNTKKLELSGTAYNLLDKYTDDKSVYTWDYVMEQDKKAHWEENHPGEPNPYACMPTMHINTYSLEDVMKNKGLNLAEKAFTFREFFRTWTGDLSKDGAYIPANASVGDFVHPDHVMSFLNLLSKDDERSKFPYATQDGCNQNVHSLWMVPGVKEAAALSKMLKEHDFFKNFGIANVAGEGDHDEEQNYSNALKYVREKIANNPCTITLSCGRLTTGVTVKEWTSVFMLSGSDNTDAKQYMQTIFRVQSAGEIGGVQKTDCYVYDFAPDRALVVIAEAAGASKRGRSGVVITDDNQHGAFNEFLKYCPVIAIDGATFKPFGVQDLVCQINRVKVGKAYRTGCLDTCIYDMSKFKALSGKDIDSINNIFGKLNDTKTRKPITKAGLGKNGLGKGKNTGSSATSHTGTGNQESKEQKALEREIIEKLNTISVRIPLLFYGGDFDIPDGRLASIVDGIDDNSWKVFMPANLTKKDFIKLAPYYDQETIIGVGKTIRENTREADSLPPTERVIAITEIFSHFQNPSHETVLTPWRVVNMHMTETLGGYCFYDDKFKENTEEYYNRLHEPRYVNVPDITDATVSNPDACILEINSKSGLYPLFVTYSIYTAKLKALGKDEKDYFLDELNQIWDEAVSQVYVLCQSSMSVQITKRSLCGYRDNGSLNLNSEKKLVEILNGDTDKFVAKICKKNYWKKGESGKMTFDAVLGNPPYNLESSGDGAGKDPIYHLFIDLGMKIGSRGTFIHPGRFLFNAGKTPKNWNEMIKHNKHFKVVSYWKNSGDIFPTVDVKGGIAITYWDKEKDFGEIGNYSYSEELQGILEKILSNKSFKTFSSIVYQRDLYRLTNELYIENNLTEGRQSEGHKYDLGSKIFEVFPEVFYDVKPETTEEYAEIYGRTGSIRTFKWIKRKYLKTPDNFESYKVMVPKSNGSGDFGEILSSPMIAEPLVGHTLTFLSIGNFNNRYEAESVKKYISTKIARAMLDTLKVTQDNPRETWANVPMQDFTENSDIDWSKSISEIDQQLYAKYGLTEEEIDFIENNVKSMEDTDTTEE